MLNNSSRSGESAPSASIRWLLASYGVCAVLFGLASAIAPGRLILWEAGAASTFATHLNQSRAASVLGLGLLALISAWSGASRATLIAVSFSSLLAAAVATIMQLTPAVTVGRWPVMILLLLWGAGAARAAGAERSPGAASAPMLRLGWIASVAIGSYALFTTAEGLLWLVSPGLLHSKMIEAGGAAIPYLAVARATVEVPIGWAAWQDRHRLLDRSGRPLLIALIVANLVLSVSGLLAQLHDIALPSRWIVEGLHVFWLAAAVWLLFRSKATNDGSDFSTTRIDIHTA